MLAKCSKCSKVKYNRCFLSAILTTQSPFIHLSQDSGTRTDTGAQLGTVSASSSCSYAAHLPVDLSPFFVFFLSWVLTTQKMSDEHYMVVRNFTASSTSWGTSRKRPTKSTYTSLMLTSNAKCHRQANKTIIIIAVVVPLSVIKQNKNGIIFIGMFFFF